MAKPVSLPRTVCGKRPDFFQTPGVDDALSMVMVLAQEFAVLRERLDSAERIIAKHGIPLAEEIESLALDEKLLSAREQWRQSFYDRLFYLAKQRRAELEHKHSEESYNQILDEVAHGNI
jgi:hypothetical protein